MLALLAENDTAYGGGWLCLSACLGHWIGKQKMCPIGGL
jgi:hypothetical protein